MERAGGLLLDRGHHRGMAVAEQQRAVAEHVADQLVAIQVPLARAPGPRDGHRERRGEPDIVGDATRHQPPGPGMQCGRAWILPRPPGYQVLAPAVHNRQWRDSRDEGYMAGHDGADAGPARDFRGYGRHTPPVRW